MFAGPGTIGNGADGAAPGAGAGPRARGAGHAAVCDGLATLALGFGFTCRFGLLLLLTAASAVVVVVVAPFMVIAITGSSSLTRLLETGDLREQGKHDVRNPMFFCSWVCGVLFTGVGANCNLTRLGCFQLTGTDGCWKALAPDHKKICSNVSSNCLTL